MKRFFILILTFFLTAGLFADSIYEVFPYFDSYKTVIDEIKKDSAKTILSDIPGSTLYSNNKVPPFYKSAQTILTFENNKLIKLKDFFTLDEKHEDQKINFLLYIAPFADTYELKFHSTSFVNDIIEYEFISDDRQILITYKVSVKENLMTREFTQYKGY